MDPISTALQVGGSLLGSILQSDAAAKSAKQQAGAQQSAMQAYQKANAEVARLQSPYVVGGYEGYNALTGRLGMPTAGVADATAQALRGVGAGPPMSAFDPQAYLAANPDVAAAFAQLSPDNLRNNLGIVPTPEAFAAWHYQQYGQFEPHRAGAPQPIAPQGAGAAAPAGYGPDPAGGAFGNGAGPAYQAPAYEAPEDFDFDIADFVNNPAYQFALQQGTGQVLANMSAAGARQSGAALKALQDRAQQTAYAFYAPERDFAFNRYRDGRDFGYGRYLDARNFGRAVYQDDRNYLTGRYDRRTDDLFDYAQLGQQAAGVVSNAALGQGSQLAGVARGIGDAYGANSLRQGDIWSGLAGSLAGLGGAYFGRKPQS